MLTWAVGCCLKGTLQMKDVGSVCCYKLTRLYGLLQASHPFKATEDLAHDILVGGFVPLADFCCHCVWP